MYRCPFCSRVNPVEAIHCYFDGHALDPSNQGKREIRFSKALLLSTGQECWSFNDLALAAQQHWADARELLRSGELARFFVSQRRPDLGQACVAVADEPDLDRGLDRLLRMLPATSFEPARLRVSDELLNLGTIHRGENRTVSVRLFNEGMGLLHGTLTCETPWLIVGDGEGVHRRFVTCLDNTTIPLHIRGTALQARCEPQTAEVFLETSGGCKSIRIQVLIPPIPFADGVLRGAKSPREIAEKARQSPRESIPLFENGNVARWYQANGWTYPVVGPIAQGVAAIQQFYEALGLAKPPQLTLNPTAIRLQGRPGQSLRCTVTLSACEQKPVYAHATTDQPWLQIEHIEQLGRSAAIHLLVPAVPAGCRVSGAVVTITGNGRQRFTVPVTVETTGVVPVRGEALPDWIPSAQPATAPVSPPTWVPVVEAPGPLLPPVPIPARTKKVFSRFPLWTILALPIFVLCLLGAAGILIARHHLRPDRQTAGLPPLEQQPKPEEPKPIKRETVRPTVRNNANPPVQPRSRGETEIPGLRKRSSGPPEILLPELVMREVEVVFCLDTTGSMGGLLNAARAKIWAMCNQVAGGRPSPQIKVGLVAYRDLGDEYVTRVHDLTADLDAIYGNLLTFEAGGGGDTPEHVNQALYDAINKMSWSTDRRTMKIVFLVGDAPPHMDYMDDVKYPETCKKAVEMGILINTIQCGSDQNCRRAWKEIASLAKGEYVAIDQRGGVVTLTTSLDEKLAAKGRELWDTALIYGSEVEKNRGEAMLGAARRLSGPTAADRVAYAAKSRRLHPQDLLDAIRLKGVKLEELAEEHLPHLLNEKKTLDERRAELNRIREKRQGLFKEILALEEQRAEELQKEQKRRKLKKDGFDAKVLEILRSQAKAFKIEY